MDTQFTFNNYQQKKAFASFLPGIAGVHGIPSWAFYCNRAQAICSFGIADKNHAIMEFFPADKSFERVSSHGFRTFVKIDNDQLYEPFSYHQDTTHIHTSLRVEQNALFIEEIHDILKIKTSVQYSTIPEAAFAALIRQVQVENLGNKRTFEIIDGMPEIVPCGVTLPTMKNMSFTARAWSVVEWESNIPIYKTSAELGDEEKVEESNEGFFFVNIHNGKINPNIIINRDIIFGTCMDLSIPLEFHTNTLETLVKKPQYSQNLYFSGFATITHTLDTHEHTSWDSYYGYVHDKKDLSPILKQLPQPHFGSKKIQQSKDIVAQITNDIHTHTSFPLFDAYCKQSYLDNIIRGGYPLLFDTKQGSALALHVYSRKHGDLERDYNFFHLAPHPYSQGNANFRDICQNRRNDVFFYPESGKQNIIQFLNLIQIDGYNPLNIKGLLCHVDSSLHSSLIQEVQDTYSLVLDNTLLALLDSFTPGVCFEQILRIIQTSPPQDSMPTHELADSILRIIMSYAHTTESADYAEGFWIDHFTYIMDLIDTYLNVFPEHTSDLLYNTPVRYFFSPASVQTRSDKYHIQEGRIFQLHAVVHNTDKATRIQSQGHDFLTDEQGAIYQSTVFEKILSIICNKISAIDPMSLGIEMEAGKPGWNDALNGMPSILGSATSEVFELARLVVFLNTHIAQEPHTINTLILEFAQNLAALFKTESSSVQIWDKASTYRELFRESTNTSISSNQQNVEPATIASILTQFDQRLQDVIGNIQNTQESIIPSFFEYIVPVENNSLPTDLSTLSFQPRPLPTFLEAPMKSMACNDLSFNKQLFAQIKQSDLYDTTLKMYKTSISLEHERIDIGRARSFTEGWLERESVFTHMELKYLLQLLRMQLYEEFYSSIHDILPCFLDPEVYGRSPLENSSFIASSVHPNPSVHGQGFSARLSGATAEILSIWKLMFFGPTLFSYHNNTLECTLAPTLDSSFFKDTDTVSTTLFSHTAVHIYNPEKLSCYTLTPHTIEIVQGDSSQTIKGNCVPSPLAEAIRTKQVDSITLSYSS